MVIVIIFWCGEFFFPKEKLVDDRVSISYNPRDPGMGDDVTFSVNLNYSKVSGMW